MDFVIPWVDNEDPEWKRKYLKYREQEQGDKQEVRFRKWDNLQYWFRGVEKYAPWIRKIHFITFGHLPSWLNVDHPKLNIVKHSEFIPDKYTPTFNSITIGLNVHRIKGLSEKYVYFNDDVFVTNELQKTDFFRDGKPCDMAVSNALSGSPFSRLLLRDMSIINKYFSKHKAIKQKPFNWFNIKYGRQNIRTLLLLPWPHTGFYNPHLTQPSLKSTLEMLWNKEFSLMNEACISKFRNYNTINDYIPRYWELASNNFYPVNIDNFGTYFDLSKTNPSKVASVIKRQTKKIVCLNGQKVNSFKTVKRKVNAAFDRVFPDKSKFEK